MKGGSSEEVLREVLQRGNDSWAFKGFGLELFVEPVQVWAPLPSVTCVTTVMAGEHDHPMVDQPPELAAEVADAGERR